MTKHPIPIVDLNIEIEIVSQRFISSFFIATGAVIIALIAVITFAYEEPITSKAPVEMNSSSQN